jgi:hypothetical protein
MWLLKKASDKITQLKDDLDREQRRSAELARIREENDAALRVPAASLVPPWHLPGHDDTSSTVLALRSEILSIARRFRETLLKPPPGHAEQPEDNAVAAAGEAELRAVPGAAPVAAVLRTPTALEVRAALHHDPHLAKCRFTLVPRFITEHVFLQRLFFHIDAAKNKAIRRDADEVGANGDEFLDELKRDLGLDLAVEKGQDGQVVEDDELERLQREIEMELAAE